MSLHPFFFFFYLYTFGHFHAKFIFSQIFIAVVKDSEKNFLRRNIRANVGRVIERRPKKKEKKPFATKLELIIARHHLCRFDRIPRKQRKRGIHSRVHSSNLLLSASK